MLGRREKVNPAVIRSVRQDKSGPGLAEHLSEVQVLCENGGEVWGTFQEDVPGQVVQTSGNGRGKTGSRPWWHQ